jgi:hypothetical protein
MEDLRALALCFLEKEARNEAADSLSVLRCPAA